MLSALLIQLLLGHAHHIIYKKRNHRTILADIHVYWGRAAITLGIINGGLGLQWAANSRGGNIAYGIVAGVVWVAWMGVGVWGEIKARGGRKGTRSPEGEKVLGGSDKGSEERQGS